MAVNGKQKGNTFYLQETTSSIKNDSICYVYIITNNITNKSYIGISSNPKERFKKHCYFNGNYKSYISESIKKHGKNNFTLKIILTSYRSYCLEIESKLISLCDTLYPNGYNLAKGGLCGKGREKGFKHTDATKDKISQSNKGKKLSIETKDKISKAHLKLNKKLTPEEKQNISNKLTGIKRSNETKDKISQSKKGKKMSEYSRQKMSDAKRCFIPWNKGKKLSNEIKEKLSQSHLEKLKVDIKNNIELYNNIINELSCKTMTAISIENNISRGKIKYIKNNIEKYISIIKELKNVKN